MLARILLTICVCGWLSINTPHGHAQIYRTDNSIIVGTRDITLGPGVDLSDWNTQQRNLRKGIFQTDLTGASFARSWLEGARFSSANLTGANFRDASLLGANFYGAILNNTDFTGAIVRSTSFWNTTSNNFTLAQLQSTASYQLKDLQGIRLSNNVITDWDLSGQNLTGAFIEDSTVTNTNLTGANLTDAWLRQSNFTGANLSHANLSDADIQRAILTGTNLGGATVSKASFGETTSRGFTFVQLQSTASYQAKDLNGIGLNLNNLSGWDFSGQNLTDAYLESSDLTGANLSNANLTRANFIWTRLQKANLSGANLSRTNLESASLTGANLRGANLSGTHLFKSNLANVDFSGAHVRGAGLNGVVATGNFTQAQLQSTASYQAKDLQGIQLAMNNLTGWDFSGQDLTNAWFGNQNIPGAILNRTNFSGANLNGTDLGYKVLTNANLSGANLYCTDFLAANLTNTDFTDANIQRANLRNITQTGFTQQQLQSTASYRSRDMQSVQLAENDLTGWDLSGQNLTSAVLTGSILTNVNLTGADLRGAVWSGRGGAILSDTILPDGRIEGLLVDPQQTFIVRDDDGITMCRQLQTGLRAPIAITIQGAMTVSEGGTVQLLFDADPWDSVIRFRRNVPIQLGGTLDLSFTHDTKPSQQQGRTFRAFDWSGVQPQGQFTIAPQLGTIWDTSKLYTTGEVTLLGLSSDLNHDNNVASDDLAALLEHWTGAEYAAADKTWRQGDSDGDGDVDSVDLMVLLSHWTGASDRLSQLAAVPEPTHLALLAATAWPILVSAARRRTPSC